MTTKKYNFLTLILILLAFGFYAYELEAKIVTIPFGALLGFTLSRLQEGK